MKKNERPLVAKALLRAASVLEGGIYGQVTLAVRKAIKPIRPQGRKKTVSDLVKALSQDPTLMNALAEDAAKWA